jgi:hypothetical protein
VNSEETLLDVTEQKLLGHRRIFLDRPDHQLARAELIAHEIERGAPSPYERHFDMWARFNGPVPALVVDYLRVFALPRSRILTEKLWHLNWPAGSLPYRVCPLCGRKVSTRADGYPVRHEPMGPKKFPYSSCPAETPE